MFNVVEADVSRYQNLGPEWSGQSFEQRLSEKFKNVI